MNLKGTGVALITPFTEQQTIDWKALESTIESIISGGIDYILVLGTTSEAPTLTDLEKHAVAEFVADTVRGRVPLMIGMGGNCTRTLTEKLHSWDLSRFDAILSVNPYYNKPNQEGLYRHFKAVSEASPKPVVLYNIQGRTGVNMLPQTVKRLQQSCPNIIGIKEASGDLSQIKTLTEIMPEDFAIISGDDALTPDIIRMGGCGVISVLAHVYPAEVSRMVRLALKSQFDEADRILSPLKEITAMLFEEGNPTGVKAAMHLKGLCLPSTRLPLVEASAELSQRLQQAMVSYENAANLR